MATLIIPDNVRLTDLAQLAKATGKALRYRQDAKPAREDIPDGHHGNATDPQPVRRLAD